MKPGELPHQIPGKGTVNIQNKILHTMCIILSPGSKQASNSFFNLGKKNTINTGLSLQISVYGNCS